MRRTLCLVLAPVVVLTGRLSYIEEFEIHVRVDLRQVQACAVPCCRYQAAAGQTQQLIILEKPVGISHLAAGHDTTGMSCLYLKAKQHVLT